MKMTIEEIGKDAAKSAEECFEGAEQIWKRVLNAPTHGGKEIVFALKALSNDISACTSVICSTLAKIEHAKTESDEDPS